MRVPVLAVLVLLVFASLASAGPLRERLAAGRADSCSASGCPAAAKVAKAVKEVAVAPAATAARILAPREGRLQPIRFIGNAARVIWWAVHPGWFGGGFPRPGPVR